MSEDSQILIPPSFVALFVPPLHSPLKGRTNLRDHRKMLIVDAATGATVREGRAPHYLTFRRAVTAG